MDDLQGPFYLYAMFAGMAIVAFVAEATIGCNCGATSARGKREVESGIVNPVRKGQLC
jgi:hypothetical protein